MLSSFSITNFKSIKTAKIGLGRITIFIGENGSGKSNILEGIAFASAAAVGKLDNSYLFSRGIRDTEPHWMESGFPKSRSSDKKAMEFSASADEKKPVHLQVSCNRDPETSAFEKWTVNRKVDSEEVIKRTEAFYQKRGDTERENLTQLVNDYINLPEVFSKLSENEAKLIRENAVMFAAAIAAVADKAVEARKFAETERLSDFIIYAPESSVLRTPPPEGYTHPIGTKGEGLFKLLRSFSELKQLDRLKEIKENLRVFGWFKDFKIPTEAEVNQSSLGIKDKWLDPKQAMFDQRSANEGFLFVLFYLSVISSSLTPKFLAFDNIENALNPRLCIILMKRLTNLARKFDKQIIFTTHSPSILDGIDLNDEDVRLYSIRRNSKGHTTCSRVAAPIPQEGELPIPLSEAFMRGIIGGLPNHI